VGAADLPISTVGFSCSLPVTFQQGAGFVTFPAGILKPDPTATLEIVDSNQSIYRTASQPQLYGRGGAVFYDRARSRWVPARREAVSADGARYAYSSGDVNTQKLHVVEVATGADRVLDLAGFPFIALVLDFATAGIYLTSGYEGPPSGLWLVDLNTGSYRKVADVRGVTALSGGFLWLSTQEGQPPENAYFPSDSAIRYDPASGQRAIWFQRPGSGQVWVAGFDAQGAPVVNVAPAGQGTVWATWLVRQPGVGQLIDDGGLSVGASDAHGLWLDNSSGLFLYAGGKLTRVAGGSGHAVGKCS
jgi:hypothetical protein